MAHRLSQESKLFWETVINDVTAPERLMELPQFCRRLFTWVRERDPNLFKKILKDTKWLQEGYKLPAKVLDWMEVALSVKPSLKPIVVADQACSIFKINPLMGRLLIKEARKIKKRVIMRKRRSWRREAYLIELIRKDRGICEECPIIRVLGLEHMNI